MPTPLCEEDAGGVHPQRVAGGEQIHDGAQDQRGSGRVQKVIETRLGDRLAHAGTVAFSVTKAAMKSLSSSPVAAACRSVSGAKRT